jgi:asparagine synthase (glutamine-hydrolysing)
MKIMQAKGHEFAFIARDKYKEHLEGKINCSGEIWKWVHLELWFREFID